MSSTNNNLHNIIHRSLLLALAVLHSRISAFIGILRLDWASSRPARSFLTLLGPSLAAKQLCLYPSFFRSRQWPYGHGVILFRYQHGLRGKRSRHRCSVFFSLLFWVSNLIDVNFSDTSGKPNKVPDTDFCSVDVMYLIFVLTFPLTLLIVALLENSLTLEFSLRSSVRSNTVSSSNHSFRSITFSTCLGSRVYSW